MGNQSTFQLPAIFSEGAYSSLSLQDAVCNLKMFLAEHPFLQEYQDEIERRLRASGCIENRIRVISLMMEANIIQLQEHLACLMMLTAETPD